jgi:hypothetical protein
MFWKSLLALWIGFNILAVVAGIANDYRKRKKTNDQ